MRSENGNLGVHNTVGWDKSKTGSYQGILAVHCVDPFKENPAMLSTHGGPFIWHDMGSECNILGNILGFMLGRSFMVRDDNI